MDGRIRSLRKLHTWPALAGLSLAPGAGTAAFDAGANNLAPTAARLVPSALSYVELAGNRPRSFAVPNLPRGRPDVRDPEDALSLHPRPELNRMRTQS